MRDQYAFYVIGAVLLLALQAAVIAGLLIQRASRRRAELLVRENEAQLRSLVEGAPIMLWTALPDMATDFFNGRVMQFTGLTMEQLLGDGWLDHVHPEDLDQATDIYVPSFAARQPFHMEYRFRRADGTYRWLLDSGVPKYAADGRFTGYVGSALDITERKEMEEHNQDLAGRLINAQETERMRIARELHDDVSQQLAGVSIMLSGLRRRTDAPGVQPDVDRTVTALEDRTSAVAEAIRALSHQLHPGVLQHAGLVATLRRHCADLAAQHDIEVTFTAGDRLDGLVPDVTLCLFRVAQEALTNAVRHAQARTIRVELTATRDTVDLAVVDDGIGFVVRDRTKSGLGLRSIDERVRLARGDVAVESQPGQGTRLIVRVPTAAAPIEFSVQA